VDACACERTRRARSAFIVVSDDRCAMSCEQTFAGAATFL
jgi:hypothetical protein